MEEITIKVVPRNLIQSSRTKYDQLKRNEGWRKITYQFSIDKRSDVVKREIEEAQKKGGFLENMTKPQIQRDYNIAKKAFKRAEKKKRTESAVRQMINRGEMKYKKDLKDKAFKLKMKMEKKIVKAVQFTKQEFDDIVNPKLTEDQQFERKFESRDNKNF